jgi:structural maintenance of chromosome 3 (chondroitin sulfate proteoglycan 6)
MIYLLLTWFQKDAAKHLKILENEIQDSMNELDKISPLYDDLVQKEKDITKRYAWLYM